MSTTQPIRDKHQVRALSEFYLKRGEPRNHLLIVMSVHTALRVSDLLTLKWEDVYDFDRKRLRERVDMIEKKTGKTKLVALNKAIRNALQLCLVYAEEGEFLMKSRKGGAISRIQAYRLIRAAAEAIDIFARVSCHSLRKTFGYHAWKSGVSPTIIMEIYNHSNFSVTRTYLGVTQDDKDDCYKKLEEVV